MLPCRGLQSGISGNWQPHPHTIQYIILVLILIPVATVPYRGVIHYRVYPLFRCISSFIYFILLPNSCLVDYTIELLYCLSPFRCGYSEKFPYPLPEVGDPYSYGPVDKTT